MFASSTARVRPGARPPLDPELRRRATPVVPASARTLPVGSELARLVPGGSLRRGTTTLISASAGAGGTSLAVGLLAEASKAGHWCAAIGLADPGIAAMAELGLDLRRAVFVPRPQAGWAEAAAELLEGVELLLLRPPARVPHAAARRLVARARDRRAVLVILGESHHSWPLPVDLSLSIEHSSWQGVSDGHGRLASRLAEICIEARGVPRPRRARLWLPSATGEVAVLREEL